MCKAVIFNIGALSTNLVCRGVGAIAAGIEFMWVDLDLWIQSDPQRIQLIQYIQVYKYSKVSMYKIK